MSASASSSSAPAVEQQSQGFFASLFEAVMPTAHAESTEVAATEDAPEEKEEEEEAAPAEEEEEEEPEDIYPAIREECAATPACAPAKTHFEHCEKKVRDGKGWEGEDCVEELFHLMHCVDECAVPQLWKKLA